MSQMCPHLSMISLIRQVVTNLMTINRPPILIISLYSTRTVAISLAFLGTQWL